MAQCHIRRTWAWVPVGGHVVFVCRRRFLSLAVNDAPLARNVLVHEALHTLGLGEDPPRSEDITAAVARCCSR